MFMKQSVEGMQQGVVWSYAWKGGLLVEKGSPRVDLLLFHWLHQPIHSTKAKKLRTGAFLFLSRLQVAKAFNLSLKKAYLHVKAKTASSVGQPRLRCNNCIEDQSWNS